MELPPDRDRKGTPALVPVLSAVGLLASAAVVFVLTAAVSGASQDQQLPGFLPTVVDAAMPVYNGIATQAGVAGSVIVQVHTDGEKVLRTSVAVAAPLLSGIAQENLKTWRFARHQPTRPKSYGFST